MGLKRISTKLKTWILPKKTKYNIIYYNILWFISLTTRVIIHHPVIKCIFLNLLGNLSRGYVRSWIGRYNKIYWLGISHAICHLSIYYFYSSSQTKLNYTINWIKPMSLDYILTRKPFWIVDFPEFSITFYVTPVESIEMPTNIMLIQ